jgi:pantetheine-phosphate adenylyltransferase, bacterial
MGKQRIAVYPGTFDPLTNGHVSLVVRSLELFDTVIIAVAEETGKQPLFSTEERVHIAEEALAGMKGVKVLPFSGLTVDFAKQQGAGVLVRGMRAVSDFDYEMQIALLNRKLCPEVQSIFLMTDYRWLFISSTSIKTAARLGGNIHGLVPESVRKRLMDKFDHPYTPMEDRPVR